MCRIVSREVTPEDNRYPVLKGFEDHPVIREFNHMACEDCFNPALVRKSDGARLTFERLTALRDVGKWNADDIVKSIAYKGYE